MYKYVHVQINEIYSSELKTSKLKAIQTNNNIQSYPKNILIISKLIMVHTLLSTVLTRLAAVVPFPISKATRDQLIHLYH